METIIKNKNLFNNMIKKVMLCFVMVFMLMFSVNAVSLNNVSVNYDIEEGFGGFIFDSQNPLGVGVSNSPKNTFWALNSQFDSYSVHAKAGKNIDILVTDYPQLNPITPFSIEITFKPTNTLGIETVFNKLNEYSLTVDGTLKTATLTYNNGLVNNVIIPNITMGQFNKVFLVWNGTSYNTYHNNISIIKTPSVAPIVASVNPLSFMGGTYTGLIDNFRIYNIGLNDLEVNNIYNYNELFNPNDLTTTPTTTPNTLINQTNIKNNTDGSVNLNLDLNKKASCQLYIDNNLVTSLSNQISYTYNYAEVGTHDYFYYCDEIINDINKVFETTPKISFNITKPLKTIEFSLYDNQSQLLKLSDLYLTTPCFRPQDLTKHYIPDKPYYIQNLKNGQASYNLSFDGKYEFCLIKGKLNYKIDDFTKQFSIVEVEKQTELGDLFVNNKTLNYNLVVENYDLYKVTNAGYWGKTTASLFQFVMGVLLGGLLILIGLGAKNDKLIAVGGLIIAIGMGVSFSTFVGVLV